MAQLFANNAWGVLASQLNAGATSLTLATGQGARFPSPTGGDFFLATLIGVTGTTETSWEVVRCTARSSDTLTLTRAQESTTDATWPAATRVELRLTAGATESKANLGAAAYKAVGTGANDVAAGNHAHAALYQPLDSDLTAVAGLSSTGLIERTGTGTAGTVTITAAGKAILDDTDAATQRATLGAASLAANTFTGAQVLESDFTCAGIPLFERTTTFNVARITGVGSTGHVVDAGLRFIANSFEQRGAGLFFYNTPSDTEWFAGRGYDATSSDFFTINRWSGNGALSNNTSRHSTGYASSLLGITPGGNTILGGLTEIADDSTSARLQVNGSLNIRGSSSVFYVNGTQVLGTRKTGWAAATGTATRTTFATTTVTLEQLAQRVKALIDDLRAHGLINT